MKNVYRSLFLLIAGASERELARQIKYLGTVSGTGRGALTDSSPRAASGERVRDAKNKQMMEFHGYDGREVS